MSILSTIGHLARTYNEARTRYRTERLIRTLPFEIQKDIGWPDGLQAEDASRHASQDGPVRH